MTDKQEDRDVTRFIADVLRVALRREGLPCVFLGRGSIYSDVLVEDGNIRVQIGDYVCYLAKIDPPQRGG